jgi:hypothetical protein
MQLFISYARVDKAVADHLVADAVALGHRPFYDRDLTGGQRWWDTLLDQIEAADAFVPVLSDDYRGSEPCRAEAAWAQACGIPFLPVATTQQPPGLYDPVIAEANWVAYDPESRDSLAVLSRSLGSIPPVEPPASAPARPVIPVSYMNTLEQQIRGTGAISRGDQLALVADLRSRVGTRDEAVAVTLLDTLRARNELTVEAATEIDRLLGRGPAAPRRTPAPTPVETTNAPIPRSGGLVLVSLGTVLWLAAVTVLPWAPFRLYDDSPVRRPALWESANIVPRPYALLAVIVALIVTALTGLALFVKVPMWLRAVLAGAGAAVGVAAVVGTILGSLTVSAGSGAWLYLVAMLALGTAAVFSRP